MEPPPPPLRDRDPAALADELVEEILLRSPPDDPARLVHAALVCKRWCRLISAHAFRRRFRPAPMLGFLCNDAPRAREGDEACSVRFVRTAASCPPIATRHGWHALDARAGRVLLHRAAAAAPAQAIRLAVWHPLARRHLDLPPTALPRRPRSWNAALLCDDDEGAFRVVLVGTDAEGAFASVYSSSAAPEPAAWSDPAYAPQHAGDHVDAARGALSGGALYFVCQRRTNLLRYDLATGAMSVVRLPPASHNQRIALTAAEHGGLGFARMEGYRLGIWSMAAARPRGAGEVEWTRDRVIDLRTLLPIIDLLGHAHGHGIVLVGTVDGFFSVDQKSGRITKVGDGPGFYNVVPYMSFCIPALGTVSTDEGASANE
ncbi:unnamed protein product [Urochloa decumbens]|uniref:F-box domain-containing protein n=1 Tax=Urochloa decumbens TaxID=240449 RepID=A0ABC9C5P2_9POAL